MVKVIEPRRPKKNWVVFNKSTNRYLGRVIKPEAENYPIAGECSTKWGWVDNIQDAKFDWIIRPPLFIIRMNSGIDLSYSQIQQVVVESDGTVTLGV